MALFKVSLYIEGAKKHGIEFKESFGPGVFLTFNTEVDDKDIENASIIINDIAERVILREVKYEAVPIKKRPKDISWMKWQIMKNTVANAKIL